jgi:hypothetical protein
MSQAYIPLLVLDVSSVNYKTKTLFSGNKTHHKNISNSIIPLVHRMEQNKTTSDDNTVSILDCVDKNPSEAESSDSDNEIVDNNLNARVAHETVNKVRGKQLQLSVGGMM